MNQVIYFIYNYCTDFVINLANITHLSYYEINFILFCILYPLLAIGLSLLLIIQKIKIGRLQKIELKNK
jgi:hypothetical protein